LRLIFLGTGDADGIPALGCRCEICRKSVYSEKNRRTRASILLDLGDYSILIDAAPEIRYQLNRYKLNEKYINTVLITHWHYEHWIGIIELHSWDRKKTQKIEPKFTIFMNKYAFHQYNKILNPFINATNTWLKERYNIKVVEEYMRIKLNDSIEIFTIPLDHTIPTTGYLIHISDTCIGYLVDTGIELSSRTIENIKDCRDLIILDVTWYKKEGKGHMSIREAIDFVNNIKPLKAFATHIGHKNLLHEELDQVLKHKTNNVLSAAYDGLIVRL